MGKKLDVEIIESFNYQAQDLAIVSSKVLQSFLAKKKLKERRPQTIKLKS